MAKPAPVPSHPDAAARWLANQLAAVARPETGGQPTTPPRETWLETRQRIEFALDLHVVRNLGPR